MDRTRPLWELNLIEGLADGRVALCMKIHHAMFGRRRRDEDAAGRCCRRTPPSGGRRCGRSSSRAPRALRPPSTSPSRVGSSAPSRSARRDHARRAERPARARAHRCDHDRGCAAVPRAADDVQRQDLRLAAVRGAVVRPRSLQGHRQGRRRDGQRRHARRAGSGTLRRYLLAHSALPRAAADRDGAPSPCAASTTPRAATRSRSCSRTFGTHLDDPLARLRVVIESTSLAKERALEDVAPGAHRPRRGDEGAPMGPSMVTGYAKRHPIYNVVISNVPGPRQPLYLDGMRLDESYPVSIPVDYLALNITIAGYNVRARLRLRRVPALGAGAAAHARLHGRGAHRARARAPARTRSRRGSGTGLITAGSTADRSRSRRARVAGPSA